MGPKFLGFSSWMLERSRSRGGPKHAYRWIGPRPGPVFCLPIKAHWSILAQSILINEDHWPKDFVCKKIFNTCLLIFRPKICNIFLRKKLCLPTGKKFVPPPLSRRNKKKYMILQSIIRQKHSIIGLQRSKMKLKYF